MPTRLSGSRRIEEARLERNSSGFSIQRWDRSGTDPGAREGRISPRFDRPRGGSASSTDLYTPRPPPGGAMPLVTDSVPSRVTRPGLPRPRIRRRGRTIGVPRSRVIRQFGPRGPARKRLGYDLYFPRRARAEARGRQGNWKKTSLASRPNHVGHAFVN